MFRGLIGGAGRTWRSERRIATIVAATNRRPEQKETNRISRIALNKQISSRRRAAQSWQSQRQPRSAGMNLADAEFLRRQQDEALADADMYTTGAPSPRSMEKSPSRKPTHFDYDTVDTKTGNSVLQKRFDALVCEAVLRYGPPLPSEFVTQNGVIGSSHSKRDNSFSSATYSTLDDAADDKTCCFYDEVGTKPHELFQMIRRVNPSFSVRTQFDNIPFSLLVKNCLYLRAWGGRVHFMRCLRQVQDTSNSHSQRGAENAGITVSLAKYKMRETSSSDGLRQGPQPWLYGYEMV